MSSPVNQRDVSPKPRGSGKAKRARRTSCSSVGAKPSLTVSGKKKKKRVSCPADTLPPIESKASPSPRESSKLSLKDAFREEDVKGAAAAAGNGPSDALSPNTTRRLLRKLSSFAMADEESETAEPQQPTPRESASRRLLRKLSSLTLPDKKSNTDKASRSGASSSTRRLLRKLSSFATASTNDSRATFEDNNMTNLHPQNQLGDEEAKSDSISAKERGQGNFLAERSSGSSRAKAPSIYSQLRRKMFVGNPTQSFAEEQQQQGQEEKQQREGEEKEERGDDTCEGDMLDDVAPRVKSTVVRYYRKTEVDEKKLSTQKIDEEEATIRQVLKEQEEAEERETVERLVHRNKHNRARRASACWRKAQMVVTLLDVAKVSKQTDSSDSASSVGLTTSDSAATLLEEEEKLEFANAFFDPD